MAPIMVPLPNLEALLQQINQQQGATFTLGERFATGEQGAYALSDASGQRFVLKWDGNPHHLDRLQHASAATTQLHAIGYPAPRYVAIGSALAGVYSIQEMLSGAPLPPPALTAALLTQLLTLNGLQRGQATANASDWPRPVVDPVLYGGDGFCLHDFLRRYSPTTAELLATIQSIVSANRATPAQPTTSSTLTSTPPTF